MKLRKQFVHALASILGVDFEPNAPVKQVTGETFEGRIAALETSLEKMSSEWEGIKEVVTILVMTNPNLSIVDMNAHAANNDDRVTSGSLGPDGRLLN